MNNLNNSALRTSILHPGIDNIIEKDQEKQTRLFKFISKLQIAIDIHSLLNIFTQEIAELMHISGIEYKNQNLQTEFNHGSAADNSASYSLNLHSHNLGEVIIYNQQQFTEEQLHFLEVLLSFLMHPLNHAIKYQQALQNSLTDNLTNVGNRAALDQTLSDEIELAKRYKSPLSILMIDVDFFKKVNDSIGHLAGDRLLQIIAAALQQKIRNCDVLFRYGGEEFTVISRKTDLEGAKQLGERARTAISNIKFTYGEHEINPTISIGVTELQPQDTAETLLKRADSALLQAKANGRNRLCILNQLI